MNLKDKIAVMQAFERGEKVECRSALHYGKWGHSKDPQWNWRDFEYRIAPKSRYLNVYVGFASAWHLTKESRESAMKDGIVGYLEDKQDGSPYIFHQL